MTYEEIMKTVNEIISRYNISYSDLTVERKEGKTKFIYLTLKFKVENAEKINNQTIPSSKKTV